MQADAPPRVEGRTGHVLPTKVNFSRFASLFCGFLLGCAFLRRLLRGYYVVARRRMLLLAFSRSHVATSRERGRRTLGRPLAGAPPGRRGSTASVALSRCAVVCASGRKMIPSQCMIDAFSRTSGPGATHSVRFPATPMLYAGHHGSAGPTPPLPGRRGTRLPPSDIAGNYCVACELHLVGRKSRQAPTPDLSDVNCVVFLLSVLSDSPSFRSRRFTGL